jgi:DNA-binding transcriptional ArsR family regulator
MSANSLTVNQPIVGDESDQVFSQAAELFGMLSTPIRLRILNTLCDGEKNVTTLLTSIATTQSNLSQHLGAMYKAGILSKRRAGNQIFYSIRNQQAVAVCRAVCNQIATQL